MPIRLRANVDRQTLVSIFNLVKSILKAISLHRAMEPPPAQTDRSASGPPPFDPTEPGVPVSFPIKTLEDLESRSYFSSFHFPFNRASVSLTGSLPNRPRILVCHDMAGGYLDDKWVQGGKNPEAYSIWHWYLIDVFVYFSHTLVTLPPPCWINTAHKHGVKVLGTFITEWDEGKVFANKLLSTKESAQMYAERLTELAAELGFDGWLINVEVNLEVTDIPNLKEFVSHLTKTMHSSVPGSLVIWYDGITVDGKLKWQDQLNESNKPFFDRCDGIFVNYNWKKDYPKRSAAVAGDRKFDVYMGIDVFGRKTYGGGQWNTHVALDVIKKEDVSAAIFAPGWIYETKQPPDFRTAQNSWWALIERSWGTLRSYPQVLPFYSNFDQGHGYHFSVDGGQVSSAPWNNISSQSFQEFGNSLDNIHGEFSIAPNPFLEFPGDTSPYSIQVLVDFKDASYSGGGNITFRGVLEDNAYFTARLFQGELVFGDIPVHFTYSVKSDGSSLIGLSLEFSSVVKEKTSILLASRGRNLLTMNQLSSKFSKVIMPSHVPLPGISSDWVIQESSIAMKGYTLTEIGAVCYKSNPEPKLQSDGADDLVAQSAMEYFATLGHISIRTPEQNSFFPPSTSWLVEGQYIKWTSGSNESRILSLKIIWRLKDGDASLFPKYNVFVERISSQEEKLDLAVHEYLGVAQVQAFYVSDLTVPSGTSSIKFIIQVCGADGACQKVDDSPFFQLSVVDS